MPQTVDVLLAARADVNARNKFGDTAIMAAALAGNLAIVRTLRARGASLENSGWTALIYAATGGFDPSSPICWPRAPTSTRRRPTARPR